MTSVPEPGVPAEEATAPDFMMIRAALVRRLGGANEALVWARIHYRCAADGSDGWWTANREDVAEQTGLSVDQVKRAIAALIGGGYVEQTELRAGGNWDRTKSYRPVITRPIDQAKSPAESERNRPQDQANSPDVPSSQNLTLNVGDAPRPDVERLCTLLADRIEGNGSKRPVIGKGWRDAARLLLDRDEKTEQQIVNAIEWCQADTFWRANILSMPTLRKRYDQMRLQAQREREERGNPRVPAGIDPQNAWMYR